jgi:hypothetical protein
MGLDNSHRRPAIRASRRYAVLGQGLASGSPLAVALAVVPVAIGGAGGMVLVRHLRRASG